MRYPRACLTAGLVALLTLPATAAQSATTTTGVTGAANITTIAAQGFSGTVRPASWYDFMCYSPLRRLKTLRASTSRTYSYDALALQQALVYLDFPPPVPIKADGWYGPATASAVRAYQLSRGLYVDGVVGPQTWRQVRYDVC